VAAVTPAHVEQFLAALVRQASRQPLTPGTVKHIWDVTRRVMKYAVLHKAIGTNPCDAVDFTASRAAGDRTHFEHRPLTRDQVGRLSAAIAGELPGLPAYSVYALMVEFMAYTGLRAAELAGVEVGDLTFAPGPKATVKVQRPRTAKAGSGLRAPPSRRSHGARCRCRDGWPRKLLITWRIRTRKPMTRPHRCGRAGRTAAATGPKGSGTRPRSTGCSRWRWARSMTHLLPGSGGYRRPGDPTCHRDNTRPARGAATRLCRPPRYADLGVIVLVG
jgi:integrase